MKFLHNGNFRLFPPLASERGAANLIFELLKVFGNNLFGLLFQVSHVIIFL